jgi:hypothetical protein
MCFLNEDIIIRIETRIKMRRSFLTLSLIFLNFLAIYCVKYSYIVTNITGKSLNLNIVDQVETSFNKYVYNISGFVKKPLNDIEVNFHETIVNLKFMTHFQLFISADKWFVLDANWKYLSYFG